MAIANAISAETSVILPGTMRVTKAPGPNVLISSLIGWKIAGIPGAFATLIAMCDPAAVLL